MEVFVLQIVTVRKNMWIKRLVFAVMIAASVGIVVSARHSAVQTQQVKIYFVDAQMLRLMPVKVTLPFMSPEKTAKRVLDELIEGRDDNDKIRRLIPKIKRCMHVKLKGSIAYVDISSDMTEAVPDGRDLELLTVYSIVNSLTNIDGIINVRFTIDGEVNRDFKGYIDMRGTFIPDYFI